MLMKAISLDSKHIKSYKTFENAEKAAKAFSEANEHWLKNEKETLVRYVISSTSNGRFTPVFIVSGFFSPLIGCGFMIVA